MSHKEQRGNKETKKPAAHSMKEKRELKHAKKHARDTPIIVPHGQH